MGICLDLTFNAMFVSKVCFFKSNLKSLLLWIESCVL